MGCKPYDQSRKTSHSKSKSREVEDDIFQESNEEDGDRQLSSFPRQLNSSSPIRKPSSEITTTISLDDSAEILGCQVTSQSLNSNSNSNVRLTSHPTNLEKHTSLSSSKSNSIEKPKQKISELSSSITDFNSENLIPNPMENNSPNNPSTHMYTNPQHLGDEEILPGTDKNSENLKETKFENLNRECLNGDIEMELSPNISEDSSGHIKTNLQS